MAKVSFTPEVKLEIAQRWASMAVVPAKVATAMAVAKRLVSHRAKYEAVAAATSVPWWLIACLHERESGADFATYLGNGEPLSRVTRMEPKGRGPFSSWERGAIDAMNVQGWTGKFSRTDWADIAFCLFQAESYNGMGYRLYHPSVPSPYIWAGTNQYTRGKYASDGKFDANLVDKQLGVATMLQALISILGPAILGSINDSQSTGQPSIPTAGATQGTGAGITITKTTTLTNMLTVAIGAVLTSLGLQNVAADALHLVGGIGGVLLMISGLINHLHVTNTSNSNTLQSIGTLLTQIGSLSVPAATPAASPDTPSQQPSASPVA